MSKINIIMDMSQYDLFLLCEERYNNRYNKNKTLPTKAKPLDRGTVLHAAQEIYYESLKAGMDYNDRVTAALSKVREAGVTQSDLEPEEIERIIQVMTEYYDFWKVADANLRVVEVEKPFIKLLYEDGDIRIYLSGKIDLLYEEKDKIIPLDHKSYDREFEILELNNQFRNYCWAVDSNLLSVNRIGFQKTLKPEQKFKRIPLSYDPYMIEQWKTNVTRVILDKYLSCVSSGHWPMNETSCDKYHRKCEYYEICRASGQEAKEYKLNTNFITIEPWDVTKVLRKPSEIISELAKESSNDSK